MHLKVGGGGVTIDVIENNISWSREMRYSLEEKVDVVGDRGSKGQTMYCLKLRVGVTLVEKSI